LRSQVFLASEKNIEVAESLWEKVLMFDFPDT